MTAMLLPGSANTARRSVLSTLRNLAYLVWFTATALPEPFLAYLALLSLQSVFQSRCYLLYGTVFKVFRPMWFI